MKLIPIYAFLVMFSYQCSIFAEEHQPTENVELNSPISDNTALECKATKLLPKPTLKNSDSKNIQIHNIQVFCSAPSNEEAKQISHKGDSSSDTKYKWGWTNISEWLLFIQEIVKAVIWPLLIFVLVYMLLPQIKNFISEILLLIPFIKRAKIAGLDVYIERNLIELKKDANEVLSDEVNFVDDSKILEQRLLAESDPRLAIINVWESVQNALDIALFNAGFSITKPKSQAETLVMLKSSRLLKQKEINLYTRLYEVSVKIKAEIDFLPRKEAAFDFIDIANLIIAALSEKTADSLKTMDDSKVANLDSSAKQMNKDNDGVKL